MPKTIISDGKLLQLVNRRDNIVDNSDNVDVESGRDDFNDMRNSGNFSAISSIVTHKI